jgi:hypothetical protein
MNQKELNVILEKHKMWINKEEGGKLADLSGLDLCNYDLKFVNLSYSNLSGVNLNNSNLSGAILTGANLSGANLNNANLNNTNLSDTDLIDVNLNGANLIWTKTDDVKGIKIRKVQFDTSRENNVLSYWVDLNIWTTGCFQGNKEELINSVIETHKDNEELRNKYLKAITYLEEL